MKKAAIFMGIGFELLALVMGALFLGREIDRYFAWPGYGVAFTVISVMAGWIYHLIILLKKFMDAADRED